MALEYVMPITQTIKVLGGKSANADDVSITYKLTPENNAPLPEEATGSEHTFSIDGNIQKRLTFRYSEAGEYSYVLERIGVSGIGGGMIDGNPKKVRIVNKIDTEDFAVTMSVEVLEGTFYTGKVLPDCSFDYKCAIRGAKYPHGTGTSSVDTVTDSSDLSDSSSGAGNGANGGADGGAAGAATSAKTGDESEVGLYLTLFIVALMAVLRQHISVRMYTDHIAVRMPSRMCGKITGKIRRFP